MELSMYEWQDVNEEFLPKEMKALNRKWALLHTDEGLVFSTNIYDCLNNQGIIPDCLTYVEELEGFELRTSYKSSTFYELQYDCFKSLDHLVEKMYFEYEDGTLAANFLLNRHVASAYLDESFVKTYSLPVQLVRSGFIEIQARNLEEAILDFLSNRKSYNQLDVYVKERKPQVVLHEETHFDTNDHKSISEYLRKKYPELDK